jgi:aminoglycoside phosphotransferase (APT) family kinase protein
MADDERLPRVRQWAGDLANEWRWLPVLGPRLSLEVPRPVAKGRPGSSYPFGWAVYRWIDGRTYADELVADEGQAAEDLARFVAELRRVDPAGVSRAGRAPLRELDAVTREAIASARPGGRCSGAPSGSTTAPGSGPAATPSTRRP